MTRRIVPVCVAWLFASVAAAAETLRVGVGDGQALPLAHFENGRPVRGILVDLALALGREAGLDVAFVVVPRKREEPFEKSGAIDVMCFLNPAWRRVPADYHWGAPVFHVGDVIIGHAGMAKPHGLDALPHGALVSTVLGYVYPGLDARFADGRLKREDTPDQWKVMLKVNAAHTLYGTSNDLSLDWFRRENPAHKLASWRIRFDAPAYHCAVPKAGRVVATRIHDALARMARSGEIERIRTRWR